MAFESLSDFLAMGNHGFYVWFAYGLTFLILGALVWHSALGHRSTLRELAAQRRRAEQSDNAAGNKTSGIKLDSSQSDSGQT